MGSEELTTKGSQRQTSENVFLYKAARRPRVSGLSDGANLQKKCERAKKKDGFFLVLKKSINFATKKLFCGYQHDTNISENTIHSNGSVCRADGKDEQPRQGGRCYIPIGKCTQCESCGGTACYD